MGLGIRIEQTRRYIAKNPSDVVFTHRTRVPDGAGGNTYSEAAVPAQRVRLIATAPSAAVERITSTGETMLTEYSILAMPDADIDEGDTFMHDGNRYEVVVVLVIGKYEKRAEAVRRA
jgi:hypothetical protein